MDIHFLVCLVVVVSGQCMLKYYHYLLFPLYTENKFLHPDV